MKESLTWLLNFLNSYLTNAKHQASNRDQKKIPSEEIIKRLVASNNIQAARWR